MKADSLTKPKQGSPFCVGVSYTMNVPVNYDDEVERKNTDPRLLPKPQPVGGLSEMDRKVLTTAMKKNVRFTNEADKTQKGGNNTTK